MISLSEDVDQTFKNKRSAEIDIITKKKKKNTSDFSFM